MAYSWTLLCLGILLALTTQETFCAPNTQAFSSTVSRPDANRSRGTPVNSAKVIPTSTTPSSPQDAPVGTSTTKSSTTMFVTSTTEYTPTTFPTMQDPSCKHRPHPTNPRLFEIARTPNMFEGEYQSCASTLVWNQIKCACDWPSQASLLDPTCGEYRKHPDKSKPWMYQRLVNSDWIDYSCSVFIKGLFSEEQCKCVYGPNIGRNSIKIPKTDPVPKKISKCVVVANITMDRRITDDSGGHLTLSQNSHVHITNTAGSIGRSALIRHSPIQVESFYANDLTDTVRFAFNFKVHRNSVSSRRYMVLLSNGCWSLSSTMRYKIRPSIEIRFRPFDQRFGLSFETTGTRVLKNIRARRDKNGWYKVIAYLQDKKLTFVVNGRKVFVKTGMAGSLRKRDCKLTIAGSPFQARDHFDGYFDEFLSIKQCRCDCKKGPAYNLAN